MRYPTFRAPRFHGTNSMPLGKLGKIEASKKWTKVHQQPWSDVFEGVEGDDATRAGSVLLAACKALAQSRAR